MRRKKVKKEDAYKDPEKTLVYAILAQALFDYRTLRLNNLFKSKDSKGTCSIQELETFFTGSWCQGLLDILNTKMTGTDILQTLKKESTEFARNYVNSYRCT